MVNKMTQKFTLVQPAKYQIKVPGQLDAGWIDGVVEMTIETDNDESGLLITTLTGNIDQAALLGLLRRLYSLGLPLISVNCLEIM
jgi:hypothetical protein